MIFSKERIKVWLRACEDNVSEVALLKSHQELQERCDTAEALLRRIRTRQSVSSINLQEDVDDWLAAT